MKKIILKILCFLILFFNVQAVLKAEEWLDYYKKGDYKASQEKMKVLQKKLEKTLGMRFVEQAWGVRNFLKGYCIIDDLQATKFNKVFHNVCRRNRCSFKISYMVSGEAFLTTPMKPLT